MKKNILKSLIVIGTVFGMMGCGDGDSSLVENGDSSLGSAGLVEETLILGTESISPEIQEIIDGSISEISQELTNTLSFMGNEERLAYDIYNYLYLKFGNKAFTNIATKGEYQHISLVQKLIQKYKLSDDVYFTNVEVPLGYMNTAIEDMEAGVYDVSKIQDLYDALIARATNVTEALKVGCIVEVVDIMDLDHYILVAEAEGATDIIEVFKVLRAGSYNHYWTFDGALQDGCCATAREILGTTECPTKEDYPESNKK
ncbi:MAG: DUF2202 domain-containing protein [Sulfurovum sp.]|nr:DUF2202 domain-containing protein [Sulfurovum sp.]